MEGVDGLSHLILIYIFHNTLDDVAHGVFATRFYRRPNPIGRPVFRLVERASLVLKLANVDMFDGTPVLAIKPYVPEFDVHPPTSAVGTPSAPTPSTPGARPV